MVLPKSSFVLSIRSTVHPTNEDYCISIVHEGYPEGA